jgi:hypothetical protein
VAQAVRDDQIQPSDSAGGDREQVANSRLCGHVVRAPRVLLAHGGFEGLRRGGDVSGAHAMAAELRLEPPGVRRELPPGGHERHVTSRPGKVERRQGAAVCSKIPGQPRNVLDQLRQHLTGSRFLVASGGSGRRHLLHVGGCELVDRRTDRRERLLRDR